MRSDSQSVKIQLCLYRVLLLGNIVHMMTDFLVSHSTVSGLSPWPWCGATLLCPKAGAPPSGYHNVLQHGEG